MNAAGNDFIIVDARNKKIDLSQAQIAKMSNRINIGCDQFIILREAENKKADCVMEIYNSDGSKSGACGNATRCVAAILMEEKSSRTAKIQTCAEILACKKIGDQISVEFGAPKFGEVDFYFDDKKFFIVDVGNPHAVCFLDQIPADEEFFDIGKKIESHQFFPQKTNVEFARIDKNNMIEIRVFERGVGETLACGTGACAVGAAAIRNNLVEGNEILARFKGGDLQIKFDANVDAKNKKITMVGDYKFIFDGVVDERFF